MAEPTSYDDMLSRLEYLTDTAETPKDKAAAAAYRKKIEAKFPSASAGEKAAQRRAKQRSDAKKDALKRQIEKMKKNPANYDQKGRYGFDGSYGIDPKSPRG